MGLVEEKYSKLLNTALELDKTSSVLQPENNSFTFVRSKEYVLLLKNSDKNIYVVMPSTIDKETIESLPSNIKAYVLDEGDNIDYVFTYIHNKINEYKDPKPNVVGRNVYIHPSAIIGVHGNTYCVCPDGKRINLKHMGNVVIEDDVDIEAHCIVHRAGMLSTIIGEGSKICVKVNFGHNCICGKRTAILPGVLLGGGTEIGDDCYIWQGAITRSNIKICNNVMIGAGSLVMNDITKPGVYFGQPAKYVKPYDKNLR